MTVHDLALFSRMTTLTLWVRLAARRWAARIRTCAARAARQDARAEEFRRNEERRRLWMR